MSNKYEVQEAPVSYKDRLTLDACSHAMPAMQTAAAELVADLVFGRTPPWPEFSPEGGSKNRPRLATAVATPRAQRLKIYRAARHRLEADRRLGPRS